MMDTKLRGLQQLKSLKGGIERIDVSIPDVAGDIYGGDVVFIPFSNPA